MAKQKTSREARELALEIHAAAIHLLRKVRREDGGSGLNAPRLSALSVVVFAGPLTLGELAAAEQVRPPTMTRIVQALAARRLVSKQKVPRDSRRTLIAATPAGRKLLLRARARRVRLLADDIEHLPAAQRANLPRALRALQELAR